MSSEVLKRYRNRPSSVQVTVLNLLKNLRDPRELELEQTPYNLPILFAAWLERAKAA